MQVNWNITEKYKKRVTPKASRIFRFIFLILILSCNKAIAQKGLLVAKDSRIEKFENEILFYLIKQKQLDTEGKTVILDDYKARFMVRKRLELFSNDGSNGLLLIQFKATSDHGDLFWGILSEGEKFFFYNVKDNDFLNFKKKFNRKKVDLIEFYCKNNVFN